jgi:hypothetical protein
MTAQYKNPMVNRALESLRSLSADRREKALGAALFSKYKF